MSLKKLVKKRMHSKWISKKNVIKKILIKKNDFSKKTKLLE